MVGEKAQHIRLRIVLASIAALLLAGLTGAAVGKATDTPVYEASAVVQSQFASTLTAVLNGPRAISDLREADPALTSVSAAKLSPGTEPADVRITITGTDAESAVIGAQRMVGYSKSYLEHQYAQSLGDGIGDDISVVSTAPAALAGPPIWRVMATDALMAMLAMALALGVIGALAATRRHHRDDHPGSQQLTGPHPSRATI